MCDTNGKTRAMAFAEAALRLDWTGGCEDIAKLNCLATLLVGLIDDEIKYYGRRVQERRWAANLTRTVAYCFGSAGLLVPTLLPFKIYGWSLRPEIGYALIAVAGVAVIGNRLFGATQGHIRFITAKYALESLVSNFGLSWARLRARSPKILMDELAEGFSLIERLRSDAYEALRLETQAWATDVVASEGAFAGQLGHVSNAGRSDQLDTKIQPSRSRKTT